jgi:hypothetical protein
MTLFSLARTIRTIRFAMLSIAGAAAAPILPDDAVTVIRRTLANPQTALAGFRPLIAGAETVRWATTFHNWIKS